MATKRRKPSKIITKKASQHKGTALKAPKLSKCKPRSLHELSSWELLRFRSALNAAANLCDLDENHITSRSKSKSARLLRSQKSLIDDPVGCRCLAVALILLNLLHGSESNGELEPQSDNFGSGKGSSEVQTKVQSPKRRRSCAKRASAHSAHSRKKIGGHLNVDINE